MLQRINIALTAKLSARENDNTEEREKEKKNSNNNDNTREIHMMHTENRKQMHRVTCKTEKVDANENSCISLIFVPNSRASAAWCSGEKQ